MTFETGVQPLTVETGNKAGYLLMFTVLSLVFALYASPSPAATDSPQELAKLYRKTLHAIHRGHRTNIRKGMRALADYPLYPYLQKAQLARTLWQLPFGDVDHFLTRYQGTVVARQLRRRWLEVLADKHQWKQFIHYYQADIADDGLHCQYLEALHQSGYTSLALSQTTDLWLSSSSLPDSCDTVFQRWRQAGLKTDAVVWRRMKLALGDGNTRLARYLSKRASAALKPYTRRLLSVHYSPRRLKHVQDFTQHSPYTADIVTHGLVRLASRDPQLTSKLWVYYRGFLNFSREQNTSIRDKVARQIIASGSEDALRWLITQDPNVEDEYLLEWRIRLALRDQQWRQANHWIQLLPRDIQQQPRWRYWQARSLQNSAPEKAGPILEALSGERNYYGFLAADLLQKPYDFNHASIDPHALETLRQNPAIVRAKTFYDMNNLTAARREWRSAMAHFNRQQLADATTLAHQWGWYQQAILTTIKAGYWDDLSIRFPLAYQQNMANSAQKAEIRLDWLYAIARQESAFAEDAHSAAGARGLMQLMPSTARRVAKSLGMRFHTRDLYHANTNIQLGSSYLKQLLDKFDGDHVLATAAYNAGPQKVDAWLKSQPRDLPRDVWIETLPFQETRNYVQNVIAYSVIYGHRLGFNTPLWKPQRQIVTYNNVDHDSQQSTTADLASTESVN